MKKLISTFILGSALVLGGCTRITDGEVGVRVSTSGVIEQQELATGWHQNFIGAVKSFPIRQIAVQVADQKPMTADNSPLDDFDATVVYNVIPDSVAEMYRNKSKSFHTQSSDGILLMGNYMQTLIKNAIVKSVRQYKSLEVNDNRAKIEDEIQHIIQEQLKAEGLDKALVITAVQVSGITPNKEIQRAATDYVRSQNELKIKLNEEEIAKSEARRQAILSANAGQSIAYMQAQSQLMIAEAVKNGKVQTIIIPSNLTALGSFSTK